MADSKPLRKESDILPDIYCEPCHDVEGLILQFAGFCEICSDNLCQNCVLAHKINKLTRDHYIQNQTGVPQKPTAIKAKKSSMTKCNQHGEEVIRSYCSSCEQLCSKICQTVDHQSCKIQSITNAVAYEADEKLNNKLGGLKALGNSSISNSASSVQLLKTPVAPGTMPKTPVFIKDIDIQCDSIRGSIMLPNQQLLLTDLDTRTVKLIDTNQNKIVSELRLPYCLWDVTQIQADEFAISYAMNNKIQFISLSSDTHMLSMGRDISNIGGFCRGIVYNDHQDNLIVTFYSPKIEILSLTGTVIKRLTKDVNNNPLFPGHLWYVALSYDKTMIYITHDKHSVTAMTLNGEVKAVYKSDTLVFPGGICVNRLGTVYVAGCSSVTVHQIKPGSDKLELLLDRKNGLVSPSTVTYCDTEDKLYVGQTLRKNQVKVFKML